MSRTRAALLCLGLTPFMVRPAGAQQATAPLLDPVFGDHAVLQRDRPIGIWGIGVSGDRVTVTLHGRRVEAAVDSAGRWRATLPAMRAGGPYGLEVRTRSGASASAFDIMIGDVWLCSGQSNMEWPLVASTNGAAEVAASATDSIRLLSVAHASSAAPQAAFSPVPEWRVAGPQSARNFSAVCWYFARALQRRVPVPMGLVNASWGGSAIQPWISEAGLRAIGGYDEWLELLAEYRRDSLAGGRHMGAYWERWWRGRVTDGSTPWLDTGMGGADWHDAPDSLRDYKTWGVPELARHDGLLWYRRVFTLTPEQAAQAASLSLGRIDEVDQTWLNGAPLGNTFGYGTPRTYGVAAGALRAGENVVTVNVTNTWAAGGMTGPATLMHLTLADGSAVPLGGHWQWRMVDERVGYPPRAPWEAVGGLTTIWNAMVAPLGAFGIRGALWYQGESNTYDAEHYQALLAGLMNDWRRQFGASLPFLVVQLPNFGAVPTAPMASGWAGVREAERRAVAADAHAGLAVTIDIGEAGNLHPPNKLPVGERLARAARRVVYGERLTPSGPVPREARREGATIEVRFGDIEGALVTSDSAAPARFELCGADQASCRHAPATLRGDRVVLNAADASGATRVRYCWGDAPVCNLRDGSGLPAGPFEIAIP